MAMTFTAAEIEDAALVLVVQEDGQHRWSSTKRDEQVATMLHEIAQRIAGRSYDPCHGPDEPYARHVAVCVPYYESRNQAPPTTTTTTTGRSRLWLAKPH